MAQGTGIRVVEAEGVGDSVRGAKEDAIRNAVQRVVGTYVSSDQVLRNHELIVDQVLSYSAGYVNALEVLASERGADGLYRTRVRASVSRQKLKRKLDELKIATVDVEGESLFGEAFQIEDGRRSTRDIMATLLAKYPGQAFLVSAGKPRLVSVAKGRARIVIPISLSWDRAFLQELVATLNGLGGERRLGCSERVAFAGGRKELPSMCMDRNPEAASMLWRALFEDSRGYASAGIPVQVTLLDRHASGISSYAVYVPEYLLAEQGWIHWQRTAKCDVYGGIWAGELEKAAKLTAEVLPAGALGPTYDRELELRCER
jgi:hypothetical protein